jgi:hypothetical protein
MKEGTILSVFRDRFCATYACKRDIIRMGDEDITKMDRFYLKPGVLVIFLKSDPANAEYQILHPEHGIIWCDDAAFCAA